MELNILPESFISTYLTNKKSSKTKKTTNNIKSLSFLVYSKNSKLNSLIVKNHPALNQEAASVLIEQGYLPTSHTDWVLLELPENLNKIKGAMGFLDSSEYGMARDQVGAKLIKHLSKKYQSLDLYFDKISEDSLLGALVGIEMSQYSFKNSLAQLNSVQIKTNHKNINPILHKAQRLGQSVNLARHLVNLPPNSLNPVDYAKSIQKLFSKSSKIKVDVWDEKRLSKENLNLLNAVGQGSNTPPRLVRISYRPVKSNAKIKNVPLAIIGKGITFDSGGLDIKPSSFMRLMKKDMGGSASALGLAYWLETSAHSKPVDIYLALAENAIGSRSFRPGDVYVARNGHKVEIDNTDAEGRLALADAITVAIDVSKPEIIIDLATLTGAGKVALGSEVASLFCNDDKLQKDLLKSSQHTQDYAWPLPLFEKYNSMFSSSFADFANSASSGYGGAITAALFLKKFIDPAPISWAHFDIYGWKDSTEGAFADKGGNGQSVQALAHWIEQKFV